MMMREGQMMMCEGKMMMREGKMMMRDLNLDLNANQTHTEPQTHAGAAKKRGEEVDAIMQKASVAGLDAQLLVQAPRSLLLLTRLFCV